MRTLVPLVPRTDMDPRDFRLWKRLNESLTQLNAGVANLNRQTTADQAQATPPTPPLIDDHGLLRGLVPVLNPDGTIQDYNDDHTQYPLIFGRPAGQYLYGSRGAIPTAWTPNGTWTLAAATSAGSATWAGIGVDTTAVAATGLILILSTHTNASLAGGETAYHTTIVDTGSNTWIKLKEFSYSHDTTTETASLWFCLVTGTLTAGISTLTANFSTADHFRYSLESYAFTMAAGLSVILAASVTDASTISSTGGATAAPMSLSGFYLSGETLFVRVMSDQVTSGGNATTYIPTGGFTAFADNHTDSTNGGTGFGQNARGEFRILSGASAPGSAPSWAQDSDIHATASIFAAVQISSGSGGLLRFKSRDVGDASIVELNGKTLNTNFDFLNFRASASPAVSLFIRGSDGCLFGNQPALGSALRLRDGSRGIFWTGASGGDVFIGTDNIYGWVGFYGQRVTKGNSLVLNQTEDASNFYQGAWGSGVVPFWPFLEMQYNTGDGTVGGYTLGEDGSSIIRRGATTVGIYGGAVSAGGGGLVIGARIGPSAGSGTYLSHDETNGRFTIRTISAGKALTQLSQIAIGGQRLNAFIAITDNAVDLGIVSPTTNRFRDLNFSGTLNHDGTFIGFNGVAPVARSTGWSVTAGYTVDKAFDPETAAVLEVARVLGTLIDFLKLRGDLGG